MPEAPEVRGQGSRLLIGFVKANVGWGVIVVTDGWQGYAPLSKSGYSNRPRPQREPRREEKVLSRVHRDPKGSAQDRQL